RLSREEPTVTAPETVTLVLAGGNGSRLDPLTRTRCKPALPFAGTLRVIDFTLLNAFFSGLREVHLLTQYLADSLHAHCRSRWGHLAGTGLSIRLHPPREDRYLGTADAVYKNLRLLDPRRARAVLILSGDHIYRADYRRFVRAHLEKGADLTVLSGETDPQDARSFGVLDLDRGGKQGEWIASFVEKPACPSALARGGRCAINLGVYCFRPAYLIERLLEDAEDGASSHDFGKDIVPRCAAEGRAFSVSLSAVSPDHRPYWRDIGTIDSYFQGHLDLLADPPAYLLADPRRPARSGSLHSLPARRVVAACVGGEPARGVNLVAPGVRIGRASVIDCVISRGVDVADGANLAECILLPGARIDRGVRLRRVIVDEGVRVPAGTTIDGGGVLAPTTPSFGITVLSRETGDGSRPSAEPSIGRPPAPVAPSRSLMAGRPGLILDRVAARRTEGRCSP
ncbi:MAG: NTP transferase domain-containing protein, partial [Planctomycetes bacterium]|nr:NTP transferase domain-containing protein [Planctomycetota bacterium]